MNDLPKNWIKFRYNGHKRYVTNWRVAEGRNGRQDYIGFERRKSGRYTNKIKRYNGPECLELEYGNLDENGNPEPALYSEVSQGDITQYEGPEEDIYEPESQRTIPINELLDSYRQQIDQIQDIQWTFTAFSSTSSPLIYNITPVYESSDEIGDE